MSPEKDDATMRGAIGKFGLMPPVAAINDEELQAVAEYFYETNLELPDWYREHYRQEHGVEPK